MLVQLSTIIIHKSTKNMSYILHTLNLKYEVLPVLQVQGWWRGDDTAARL